MVRWWKSVFVCNSRYDRDCIRITLPYFRRFVCVCLDLVFSFRSILLCQTELQTHLLGMIVFQLFQKSNSKGLYFKETEKLALQCSFYLTISINLLGRVVIASWKHKAGLDKRKIWYIPRFQYSESELLINHYLWSICSKLEN